MDAPRVPDRDDAEADLRAALDDNAEADADGTERPVGAAALTLLEEQALAAQVVAAAEEAERG